VPYQDGQEYTSFDSSYGEDIVALSPAERKAMFSDKDSDFNRGVEKKQAGV